MWFVKRAPGVDLEAFRQAWASEHATRVRAAPGVARYVRSFTLLGGYRKGEPRFDCVTELWLDDATVDELGPDAERLVLGESGGRIDQLVDPTASLAFLAHDVVIKDGAAAGLKSFSLTGPRRT